MTVWDMSWRDHAVGIHVSQVTKRVYFQSNGRVYSCVHLRIQCFDPVLALFGPDLALFGPDLALFGLRLRL